MALAGYPGDHAEPAPAPEPGASGPRVRTRVAEPQHSDASILESTGHSWDEWADLIDAGPGRDAGHTAIAAWVHTEHGVPGWWAQGVTVGYERIVGLRLPGQMHDGSYSISRSRVLGLDRDLVRELLLDPATRADLFPGFDTELRSAPTSKALRFGFLRDGVLIGALLISMDPLPDGRIRLGVMHDKLATFAEGTRWKAFWTEWLDAMAAAAAAETAAVTPARPTPSTPLPS